MALRSLLVDLERDLISNFPFSKLIVVAGSIGRQTQTQKRQWCQKSRPMLQRQRAWKKLEAMLQSYTVVLQFKIFDNAFVLFAVHQYCKLTLDVSLHHSHDLSGSNVLFSHNALKASSKHQWPGKMFWGFSVHPSTFKMCISISI